MLNTWREYLWDKRQEERETSYRESGNHDLPTSMVKALEEALEERSGDFLLEKERNHAAEETGRTVKDKKVSVTAEPTSVVIEETGEEVSSSEIGDLEEIDDLESDIDLSDLDSLEEDLASI